MTMRAFRKASSTRSVMFAVGFEDGRTAYLVVENHGTSDQDYQVAKIARQRQAEGALPEGEISSIKRVR